MQSGKYILLKYCMEIMVDVTKTQLYLYNHTRNGSLTVLCDRIIESASISYNYHI